LKTGIIQLWISAIAFALLSGCGVIPFKASTNDKADAAAPPSPQVSFKLRETRFKQTKSGGQVDCNPKRHKDVLVLLALSGGGSRAALLSGLSMLQMQDVDGVDVLSDVDLISSVSGGSLAAAYYAVSGDENAASVDAEIEATCGQSVSGRVWSTKEVTRLMTKNYILPWVGNWFWPDNIALYWFSTYDRTDMMAQTFADNLFDTSIVGRDLRMSELNPSRPNLIVNATQGSPNDLRGGTRSNEFGQPFTFTEEDFAAICSRVDTYEISRAVMASATFPGVFNFMTLKNRCPGGDYVHLFDGGNSDNLGLTSIKRELWNLNDPAENASGPKLSDYRKIIVILIDAYTDSNGVDEHDNDPRKWYDYVVDTNFITATDSLLAKNRDNLVAQFERKDVFPYAESDSCTKPDADIRSKLYLSNAEQEQLEFDEQRKRTLECQRFFSWKRPEDVNDICDNADRRVAPLNDLIRHKMLFVHVSFADIGDVTNAKNADLNRQLNRIATDFRLSGNRNPQTGLTNQQAIECAVPLLFGRNNDCGDISYTASHLSKSKWREVRDALSN